MMSSRKILSYIVVCSCLVGGGLGFSGCTRETPEEEGMTMTTNISDIKQRLQQFSPTELSIDEGLLSTEQKQVVAELVEAARYVDEIFWKQASSDGLDLRSKLEAGSQPADRDLLQYLKIHYGRFDRLEANQPFIGIKPKPAGAGFYPEDMTKQEFLGYLSAHPDDRKELESPFTVIRRTEQGLAAVPYNVEYRSELEPIADHLWKAAEITTNPSLKKYLNQRAADLLSNDYYQSDIDWIDLEGNLVEIVIGPYEVYEDGLMGIKAAYECFVYVNDRVEMAKIQGTIDYLEEMQKNLPVEPRYRDQKVAGLKSPLNVVHEVFSAGDGRVGVQSIAFVLPNDERVREEKGSKKVMIKNMMEAKFNKTLIPIARKTLAPDDADRISFYAFFNQTILHEVCHALGVNYTLLPDGTRVTVNRALQEHYSPIEEAKADVAGLYSVPLLMERGWIPRDKGPEIYTTYLAGMFRSLRFGLHEAHGLGTLIQYNFMREQGAFVYDAATGRYSVDIDKIVPAVRDLCAALLVLEGDGDYDNAGEFIEKYGRVEDILENTVATLDDIPVDILPIFKYD